MCGVKPIVRDYIPVLGLYNMGSEVRANRHSVCLCTCMCDCLMYDFAWLCVRMVSSVLHCTLCVPVCAYFPSRAVFPSTGMQSDPDHIPVLGMHTMGRELTPNGHIVCSYTCVCVCAVLSGSLCV
jgi:hypothetical protein